MGFLVDGGAKTVRIYDGRATNIVAEIHNILKKKYVQLKHYRRIIGKIRHAAIIFICMKGIFLSFNKALKGGALIIGLGGIIEIRVALLHLSTMFTLLASCPHHVK